MKKIIFAVLVSVAVAPHVFAGEEIQLAAAIGSTNTPAGASGSGGSPTTPAGNTGTGGGLAGGLSTPSMIAIGVVGAGALAAIAGSNSTSNH